MDTAVVAADELHAFAVACFRATNVPPEDARRAADVLLWASLRGVDTHGFRNLRAYYIDSAGGVGRRDGVIRPDAALTVEAETETTAALNANGGLGLSMSVEAMGRAIDKAAAHGAGVVTIRNSTHFGAAGCYAEMAVEHGMLGFASTGYFFPHGQEKAVVPFGGLLPMLSTNPLAMACPAGEFPPFVLDMSTSMAPVNRIEMLQELGRAIPLTWALDADHRPTADPAAVQKVVPLGGAVEHGGHKGYGLALAGWILTGLLSGAWRSDPQPDRVLGSTPETKHGFAQEGIGHAFAAVRIDRFCALDQFKRGIDAMIRAVNESPPAEGFQQVLVPGQREEQVRLQRLQRGIPLAPSTVADLRHLSAEFGIPLRMKPGE